MADSNQHIQSEPKPEKQTAASSRESLIIRQRLRNLCELAVAIGYEQGLLGTNGNSNQADV